MNEATEAALMREGAQIERLQKEIDELRNKLAQAFSFGEGPVTGVHRIWVDTKLIWDSRSEGDEMNEETVPKPTIEELIAECEVEELIAEYEASALMLESPQGLNPRASEYFRDLATGLRNLQQERHQLLKRIEAALEAKNYLSRSAILMRAKASEGDEMSEETEAALMKAGAEIERLQNERDQISKTLAKTRSNHEFCRFTCDSLRGYLRIAETERDEARKILEAYKIQAESDEIEIARLLKIIEDAEHAEDCPLYGIRSAPLGDRLHICNCFKQRALKVKK